MTTQAKTRRKQQRAIDTQTALLDTAVSAFSRLGFDGASVRQIEEIAGVNRGLVAYHFGDKAELWRRAASRLFARIQSAMTEVASDNNHSDGEQLAREIARTFVRYSAAEPALNRMMMQESMQPSWRVDFIVNQQIQPMMRQIREQFPEASRLVWGDGNPHRYYAFVGAAAFVFSAAEECKALFGQSPSTEAFIEAHADLVMRMLFPPLATG